ncbi:MAG: M23 family metallopeptidase [Bacteroidota bacterium]
MTGKKLFIWIGLFALALLIGFNADAQRSRAKKKAKPKTQTGASRKGSKGSKAGRRGGKSHRGTGSESLKIKAPGGIQGKKPRVPEPVISSQQPDGEKIYDDTIEIIESVPALELYKELSMLNEDTGGWGSGEISMVEISEEVKVDSTWVRIAEYYSLWDSKRINPYRIDKDDFDEPQLFHLYDTAKGQLWHMPIRHTQVNSRFGFRGHRFHFGTDLELNTGDTVMAAFDGIIRAVGWDGGGYGNYIVVRHYNGFETLYGHLSRIDVESQQMVKAGDMIGLGGSTGRSSGPHLHYEVRYQGNAINTEEIYNYGRWALDTDKFLLTPQMFNYMSRRARKVVYHRVRGGETLSAVSRKYGISVSKLAKLNGLKKGSALRSGRRLRIK